MLRTLALERLRYEDLKFKDSMNFTVRPYQKKKQKTKCKKHLHAMCIQTNFWEKMITLENCWNGEELWISTLSSFVLYPLTSYLNPLGFQIQTRKWQETHESKLQVSSRSQYKSLDSILMNKKCLFPLSSVVKPKHQTTGREKNTHSNKQLLAISHCLMTPNKGRLVIVLQNAPWSPC